jgi:virulence factor Mce-like protein
MSAAGLRSAVAGLLAAAAVVVVAVVLLSPGDGKGFTGTVLLKNADGLRQGSTVRIGGVAAGRVTDLELGAHDVVVATFELDPDAGPLGRGFRTSIRAANLLGEKYLQLDGGDKRHPEPSGVRVDVGAVPTPVELDDVLDVLDPTTRARTQILINELGASLTGQKANFSALLQRLPSSLESVDRLVAEVASENRSLGRALDHSNRFVAALAGQHAQLGRLVDAADGAIGAFDAQRAALGTTLDRAPRFVSEVTGWLVKLRQAAAPLKPAAELIAASAPGLDGTLAQVEPFQKAASPTLERATKVAPRLSRLGREATPVLRQAVPPVRALATFAEDLKPTSAALRLSVDDVLGTVEGWARSIQNRDGIGHVFRGRFTAGMDLLRSALSESTQPPSTPPATAKRKPGKDAPAPPPPSVTPGPPTRPGSTVPGLKLPPIKVPPIAIGGLTIPGIELPLPGPTAAGDGPRKSSVQSLLDYLLKP